LDQVTDVEAQLEPTKPSASAPVASVPIKSLAKMSDGEKRAEMTGYLRGIKNRSDRQIRMLKLIDAKTLTADDEAVLSVLYDVEIARMVQRDAVIRLRKADSKPNSKLRRDHTTMLCKLGGLVMIAGLQKTNKAVVLGALMEVAQADEATRKRWESAGAPELEAREHKKRRDKAEAII